MKAKILILEDETSLRDSLAEALKQAGFETSKAKDGAEGYKLLQQGAPDLVLCDWMMPVMDAPAFLKLLSVEGRLEEMPVLVLTAHGTSSNAIEAMQLGAYDFITKPFDLDDVLAKIHRTLQHTALQKEVLQLRQRVAAEDQSGAAMVGISAPMIEVFKSIGRIARTESTVLITGESGTGKELVARSIHSYSPRKHKPFMVINCATLSETLAESELFGYERGAFTGAQSRKSGKFESADGGTVFLDEVGELPAGLQPKLLRVLQEHTFERVGGTESLTADCRILAATNRNLYEEVLAGRFRQDLYFRLNVLSIQLPALRERRSDVLPLAEHFLLHFSRKHGLRIVGFTEGAALELQRYGFPGNVRELQHIVERAVLQAGGRAISAELLGIQSQPTASKAVEEEDDELRRLLRLPFHQAVEEFEQILIHKALAAANGNKAEAARTLGMHRRLLYEKLEKDKTVSQT